MKKFIALLVLMCIFFAEAVAVAECRYCGSNNIDSANRRDYCLYESSISHTWYYYTDVFCKDCFALINSEGPYPEGSESHNNNENVYTDITYHNDATHHWKEGNLSDVCQDCWYKRIKRVNEIIESESHYMASTDMRDEGHVGMRHYYTVICGKGYCRRYYTISIPCKGGTMHVAPFSNDARQ